VQVALDDTAESGFQEFMQRFAQAHRREYGYDVDGRAVQVINVRVQALGQVVKAPLAPRTIEGSIEEALTGRRSAYFGAAHGWADTPVYDRTRLPTGQVLRGPALIEEMSSTTIVGVGHHAVVDDFGNLIITLQGNANG
jgi:N-methylhydantoinase A